MEALWAGGSYSLGELAAAVDEGLGWSKNTLATYLKRMAAKGLVKIERGAPKPYSAAVERDDCARAEREALLNRVYNGAAGELIAAFLTESRISRSEASGCGACSTRWRCDVSNIWEFFYQTLSVSLAAAVLLAVKWLLRDKLSPRWQYAVWACWRSAR